MIRLTSILISTLLSLLFLNCKNETADLKIDYNRNANELIQQVILDESCNCILEIPNESMIKIKAIENPMENLRKKIIQDFGLRDQKELDSLEIAAENFTLNTDFLKKKNIIIIKRDSIREITKDSNFFKKCPNGVLTILKPIFNKKYNKAIIDCNQAFMCLSSPEIIYNYEKGKWNR